MVFVSSPRIGQSWFNLAGSASLSGFTADGVSVTSGNYTLPGYTETAASSHEITFDGTKSAFACTQYFCQAVIRKTSLRDWATLRLTIVIGATPYYVYQAVDLANGLLGLTTGSTLTISDSGIDSLGSSTYRVWFIAAVGDTVATDSLTVYGAEAELDQTYTGDTGSTAYYVGGVMMLCEGDETVPYQVPG